MRKISVKFVPDWMEDLEIEDVVFIKNFVLMSGSLKEIAKYYGVTYPTVRLRLDKLIQKIEVRENTDNSSYVSLIKRLALDEKIDFDVAKVLITEYKKELHERER